MRYVREKAKSSWLLTFGDLVTLLITLFILMVVIYRGEISDVQKWGEDQLDKTEVELKIALVDSQFISVKRVLQGVQLDISANNSFVRGGFEPMPELKTEIETLGVILKGLSFLSAKNGGMPEKIAKSARKDNLILFREVSVSGHTDNDPINPSSKLRNNWFLSAMRAQTVMELLYQTSALPAEMLSISGRGEYHPIASNATDAGKVKNRRVQIVIIANFEKATFAGSSKLVVASQ